VGANTRLISDEHNERVEKLLTVGCLKLTFLVVSSVDPSLGLGAVLEDSMRGCVLCTSHGEQ
jgi:hypothetical protein